MDCKSALAIASDLVDAPADERRRAQVHVATCSECANVRDDAEAKRRLSRQGTKSRSKALTRFALSLAGVVQLFFAVPWLLGSDGLSPLGHASSEHLTRDGAFGLALAGMSLLAAWRLRWSAAFSLVAGTLLIVQIAIGFADKHAGKVELHFELTHLLGVALLGSLIAGWTRARESPTRVRRSNSLRVR